MTVQELFMPCKVYSGIEPPAALVEEMFKRQHGQPHDMPYTDSKPPSQPSALPPRPQGQETDAPLPAYTPAAPGAAVSSGPTGAGATGTAAPEEPPPSYEDAMAEDIGPVDGRRANYEQPQSEPVVGDEKRGSMFGN
jgi:hypothetical protein